MRAATRLIDAHNSRLRLLIMSRMTHSALGAIIRNKRQKLGLTQEQVAELAELHRNYVGDIERGLKEPTVGVFIRLCHAVKLQPAEVLKTIINRENPSR
jgi:transcriptional regulator with XRE-family HTH domain